MPRTWPSEEFIDHLLEDVVDPLLARIKKLEERADLADLERRLAEPDIDHEGESNGV